MEEGGETGSRGTEPGQVGPCGPCEEFGSHLSAVSETQPVMCFKSSLKQAGESICIPLSYFLISAERNSGRIQKNLVRVLT